jgi:hypothetical protein
MSWRFVTIPFILALFAPPAVFAQASEALPRRWFAMSGGWAFANGGGYMAAGERQFSVSAAFPAYGHRFEATALGAWTDATVGCNADPCAMPPELVGASVSLIRRIGSASDAGASSISIGIGGYRLPSGSVVGDSAAGIFPGGQAGFEKAFVTSDGFGLTVGLHMVFLPYVHGKSFVYIPLSFGFRMW